MLATAIVICKYACTCIVQIIKIIMITVYYIQGYTAKMGGRKRIVLWVEWIIPV
jgi:hypothetical protein